MPAVERWSIEWFGRRGPKEKWTPLGAVDDPGCGWLGTVADAQLESNEDEAPGKLILAAKRFSELEARRVGIGSGESALRQRVRFARVDGKFKELDSEFWRTDLGPVWLGPDFGAGGLWNEAGRSLSLDELYGEPADLDVAGLFINALDKASSIFDRLAPTEDTQYPTLDWDRLHALLVAVGHGLAHAAPTRSIFIGRPYEDKFSQAPTDAFFGIAARCPLARAFGALDVEAARNAIAGGADPLAPSLEMGLSFLRASALSGWGEGVELCEGRLGSMSKEALAVGLSDAAFGGSPEACEALVRAGARADSDALAMKSLAHGFMSGEADSERILEILKKAGGRFSEEDAFGKTPEAFAPLTARARWRAEAEAESVDAASMEAGTSRPRRI